ncbi:MFS transporter, NNP family, nitrate/nitrite transporter [Reichenbachiella faecimaris]|uniref:MFS transporter, NNP family, nitrate/nitrite transporter n=1 Tax=Reichenbachiella faecimaris TaxID=692418 RepID=A0A1W2GNG2_REIFA|nr:MFS transporter [Reichenbachiella faecimaris]SMD38104.1 MFS transporter, NNP family, nitrate/nitrite transporter [Reichenbachiella faecimaris]
MQTIISQEKATRINLFDLESLQMRTFHLSWIAFFLCFFGWFAHAPLMNSTIGPDMDLTKAQKITAFIASVGVTIFARLIIGSLCDKIGPRKSYTYLLVFGALVVAGSSFAYNWETYLISRMAIGVIGASFVITQYHTTKMFAPNVVGIANATTAGWGNLGGGVTQAMMPLIASGMLALGFAESELSKWRPAMFVPALIMLGVAFLYWKYTKDTPKGNFDEAPEEKPQTEKGESGLFMSAVKDRRVWILFAIYGACFGLELFVNGRAATYYQTKFELNETTAGMIAALFGLMNLFARSMGGWLGDRFSKTGGLSGRVKWLVMVLFAEGFALMLFSRMDMLGLAIITMIIFSLFVQMAEGATFSVVPFINTKSLGAVAGIVGAGGNVGAVMYAQFLLRSGATLENSFLYFGMAVVAISLLGLGIKFSDADEAAAVEEQKKLEDIKKQLLSKQKLAA